MPATLLTNSLQRVRTLQCVSPGKRYGLMIAFSCVAQLELSETRGQLRAARAASAETCERVESLAAKLAAAHHARPLAMIWENPQVPRPTAQTCLEGCRMQNDLFGMDRGAQSLNCFVVKTGLEVLLLYSATCVVVSTQLRRWVQGQSKGFSLDCVPLQTQSLSATGSGSMLKALQSTEQQGRDAVARVPSRPASPAAARSGAPGRAARDPGHLAAGALQRSASPAGSPAQGGGNAGAHARAADWDLDQENDGGARECYSLPAPPIRHVSNLQCACRSSAG